MKNINEENLRRIRGLSRSGLQSAIVPLVITPGSQFRIDFQIFDTPTGFVQFCIDQLRYRKYEQTLLIDSFYPHIETRSLERIGIGTLTLLKGLDILLERNSISPQHFVFYHPKVSLDARQFFNRLDVFSEGLQLREYYNRAANYARTKGFSFTKI